jgi:hypothetical protein
MKFISSRVFIALACLVLIPLSTAPSQDSKRESEGAGSFSVIVSMPGSVAKPVPAVAIAVGRDSALLNRQGFPMSSAALTRLLREETMDGQVIVFLYVEEYDNTTMTNLSRALVRIRNCSNKAMATTVYLKLISR